ncbi:MAG: histidine kinase [Pseudomonadota bacterium]
MGGLILQIKDLDRKAVVLIALALGIAVLGVHLAIVAPIRLIVAAAPYQNFIGLGVTTILQLIVMLAIAMTLPVKRLTRLSGFVLLQLPLFAAACLVELADTVQFYERFNLPYRILTWTSFLGHTLRLYTVFVVWTAVFGFVLAFIRLEHQGRQLAEAQSLARMAELTALRYQLQPHFLFNAFSTLHALIDEGQRETSLLMLEKLSTVFRSILSSGERDMATVRDELDFLKNYLAIEQLRFAELLHVDYQFEEGVSALPLPRLLLQPIVENAIKHARPRDGSAQLLMIRAWLEADQLRLSVGDNGPGFGATPHTGVGLRNVVDRLERYFGAAGADIDFGVSPLGGGLVTLSISEPALEAYA